MATEERVGGNEWGRRGGLVSHIPSPNPGSTGCWGVRDIKYWDHIRALPFCAPEAKGESWASNPSAGQSEAIQRHSLASLEQKTRGIWHRCDQTYVTNPWITTHEKYLRLARNRAKIRMARSTAHKPIPMYSPFSEYCWLGSDADTFCQKQHRWALVALRARSPHGTKRQICVFCKPAVKVHLRARA